MAHERSTGGAREHSAGPKPTPQLFASLSPRHATNGLRPIPACSRMIPHDAARSDRWIHIEPFESRWSRRLSRLSLSHGGIMAGGALLVAAFHLAAVIAAAVIAAAAPSSRCPALCPVQSAAVDSAISSAPLTAPASTQRHRLRPPLRAIGSAPRSAPSASPHDPPLAPPPAPPSALLSAPSSALPSAPRHRLRPPIRPWFRRRPCPCSTPRLPTWQRGPRRRGLPCPVLPLRSTAALHCSALAVGCAALGCCREAALNPATVRFLGAALRAPPSIRESLLVLGSTL